MDNTHVIDQLLADHKQTYDQLIVIIDKSGSMKSILTDAQGGINSFIDQQKQGPRPAKLLLVEFNGDVIKHENIDIKDVGSYQMMPVGGTALYDAIGKTITEYSHQGDEKVIVAIVTDGEENASKQFTKSAVAELVQMRQDQGWEFVYLGANLDTFNEAQSLGMLGGSTIQYDSSVANGYSKAFAANSAYVTSLRTKTREMAQQDLQIIKGQLGDLK